MLVESNCRKRRCKHYGGMESGPGVEEDERYVCAAFPDRVPGDIVVGKNLHDIPVEGQENKIVFEVVANDAEWKAVMEKIFARYAKRVREAK